MALIRVALASTAIAARSADACPESSEGARLLAKELLSKHDFAGARRAFEEITVRCPEDAAAWRDIGRTAAASGDAEAAEVALLRAHALAGGAADPELHFLRGEALYTLGRSAEARAEHDQLIREVGPAPTERLARLWLARIHVRRGDHEAADALFAAVEDAAGAAGDEEASASRSEALIQIHAYARAEQVLRRMLARTPRSARARELLAWVFELQGDSDAELAMRRSLVAARPEDPAAHRDLARVLERRGFTHAALVEYRRARALHDGPEIAAVVERIEHRLAPEFAVTLSSFNEASAASFRLQSGGVAPVSEQVRFGLIGMGEAGLRGDVRSRTFGATGFAGVKPTPSLDLRLGVSFRHGVLPRRTNEGYVYLAQDVLGGEVAAVATLGGAVIDVQANFHALWDEAAISIVEGGDQTGTTAHVGYPVLRGRIILDASVLARQLRLARDVDGDLPQATHVAWSAGADLVAWAAPQNRLRGEILDDRLARSSDLQDALVIGYRHYDANVEADAAFLPRVALAPRARFEAISATLRKVLSSTRAGIEVRGTAGYDYARDTRVLIGGIGIFVSSWAGRLVLLGDMASETSGVILGNRSWLSVSYHQDLL